MVPLINPIYTLCIYIYMHSDYLLGPISPDRGADLLGVDVHVAVVIAS